MNLLITQADIIAIESYSSNTDFEKKLRPYIIDAQDFHVRELIGEEFWIDLCVNPGNYPDLLSEKIYTYGGHTYQHPGLKAVIVEYAYSLYKGDANVHDTPYGLQMKKNDYSEAVPESTVARHVKRGQSQAEAYWKRVEAYLDRFRSAYPLWRLGCNIGKSLTGNGTKIRKVTPNNYKSCRYKPHR